MKKVYLIKNSCPLCGGDVKGNPLVRYYCKKCNILFDYGDLNVYDLKKQMFEEIEDVKSPLVKEKKRKLVKLGLKREKGWLYFIDKEGDIARAKMSRGGKKGKTKQEKVEVEEK